MPAASDKARTTDIAIISSPAIGDAYRLGETVEVEVMYSEAVTVRGAPLVGLSVKNATGNDDNEYDAAYVRGSGTTKLVFSFTVPSGLRDDDGIQLYSSPLRLNGATITAVSDGDPAVWNLAAERNIGGKVDSSRTPSGGICSRTPQVRDAIVAAVAAASDCSQVTNAYLTALTGTLEFSGLTSIAAGDLAGLSSLTRLNLYGSGIETLPVGLFDGLGSLTRLDVRAGLTHLPKDIFRGLGKVTFLSLDGLEYPESPGNRLREGGLPDGIFEPLSRDVKEFWIFGSPGSESFRPRAADAGPGGMLSAGQKVTLGGPGNDGGPWGSNVFYRWRQKDGSGNAVSTVALPVTDEVNVVANPSFTVPTLAETTEVRFQLRLDGAGKKLDGGAHGDPSLRLGLYSPVSKARFTILALAPTGVAVVSKPVDGDTYRQGEKIEVAVTFGDRVLVDTSLGTPTLGLAVGTETRQATYVRGTGSNRLVFEYTVQSGDTDGDGIAVAANGLAPGGGAIASVYGVRAILDHAALAAQTGHKVDGSLTHGFDLTGGVCGRTSQVRDKLLELVKANDPSVTDCSKVETTHLAALTEDLELAGKAIATLKQGDFANLGGIDILRLQGNDLTALPASVFDGLTGLSLIINLRNNNLSSLPPRIFEKLTGLTGLSLNDNPGSAGFVPTAKAGPAGGIEVVSGGSVTLGVEGAENGHDDPWGSNVTWSWSRTGGAGGTLTDAAAARATFTAPATGEDGTHVFRLKVIGAGDFAATADVAIRVAAGPKAVEAAFAPVGGTAYAGGETIEVALHFDRAVTVDIAGGTPSVTLTVGAVPRTAGYLRGSGTGALTFGYTVQAADMDADGVDLVANSLALNGGKIAAVSDGGVAVLGHAALAGGSGRTVNVAAARGICDRTATVQTAILERVRADENDASLQCGDIGPVRLVAIGGRLDLSAQARNGRMTALRAGDFAWLANVTGLDLDNHALRSFPAGVFDPLTSLSELSIAYNQTQAADRLTSLPAGLFDGLTKLTTLRLEHNDLETLPDGIFEKLTRLTTLTLHGNPGSAAFLPVAAAGPAGGLEAETGERVTLGGDAGGPWGGNVVHAWRQVSGTAVALSATDAAKPAFAAPALAGPEDLAFELMVTGRGTSLTATDRVSVRIAAAAAVSSVVPASTPIDGDTYRRGETIGIAVGFAKPVTVTGTPQLALSVGTNTRQAAYVRGSGTGQLVFEYTVLQADTDSDGIAIAADSLAPGTGAIADATGMAVLLGHPALAAQAAHRVDGSLTHAFNPTAGICGRTAPVRDGLLLAVRARTGDTALGCAQVTTTHLGALSGTLILAHKGIGTLKPGDFANLGGIAALQLDNNDLTALPAGVFEGLDDTLTVLQLHDNDLQTIPAGVFDRLTGLTTLSLHDNRLPSLPDRIFEGLMKLTQLSLNGNPGSADFKPTAKAGPAGGIDVPQGATTGITLGVEVPENGNDDPWGTNVTYAWSRTEGTGGTLTDATAAQAVFTPPATDGTHAFRLTVTGGGGVAGTSTVSVHVGAAGVPPMPVSAVVNGPTLTLTYSKNLQAEPPPASDSGKGQVYLAVVSVPGVRRNIEPVPPSAVEVMGRQVILTFKPSIDPNRVVTLSYFPDNATAESRIRDRGGNLAGGFAGLRVRNVLSEGPVVRDIAFAGAAKTYRIGDTVGIDVTFSDPVAVTVTGGAPTLALEIGSANRKARWKAGQAAGAVQRFEYTVAEGEEDTDGIAVEANGLEVPSGSSILNTEDREAAILRHGRYHDPAYKVDGVLPTATAASAAGPTVTVTWSEALDPASLPTGAGGFRVRIGNANGPAVSAVAVSGATTTLSLASAIADGTANVTLEYSPLSGAKIRDAAGNDAAAIPRDDALAVTVPPDQRAPEVSGTPMVDGTTLTLTFDEALDTASVPPAPGGFTVTVTRGGSAEPGYTVSGLSLSPNGRVVTLTLAQAVRGGDTVTLAYVQPSSGTKLQDRATTPNPVADFTTGSGGVPAVDNRTPSVKGAPVFAGAAEAYAIGDRIAVEVEFTQAVSVTTTSSARPEVAVEVGANTRKARYASGSDSARLRFEYAVVAGDADSDGIAIPANALAAPAGSAIRAGSRAVQLGHDAVVADPARTVDGVRPTATAAAADGLTVEVTWSEALDPASAGSDAGGFGVKIGTGNGPAVTAVAVDGTDATKLRLTLAERIADGTQNATLEYRPPSSGAKIRDAAGSDAEDFTGSDAVAVSVTPDTTAPMLAAAAVNGARLTLTFDEALDTASIPAAPGGFTVTVTRVDDAVPGHTVTGIAVSGATVTLTLAKGVLPGDTVTLDYVPTSTRLQDRAATPNPVAGFSGLDMKMVDNASDALEVSLSTTEAVEGDDGTVTLTVAVTGGGTSGVARAIAIAPVASPTAAETEDWTLPAGQRSLTLGAGQRSVSAAISVVDDARLEDAETVSFAVTADGAAIGQVTLTIADDDKAVLAVRGPAQVTEGQPIELTLRLEPHPENVANVSAVPDDACILDFPVTATLTRAGDIAAALPSDPTLATDHSFAATSFDDCTREVTVSVPTRAPDAVWMADRALTFALAPKNSDPRVEAGEALSAAVRDDTPEGNTVQSFAVTGPAKTYRIGDTIGIDVTFAEAVTVTGAPTLALEIGAARRKAAYVGGSGSAVLTFEYTVVKGEEDTDGIAVAANGLEVPAGSSILNTVDREAAILRHGRYHDPAYKVDGVLPAATAASAAGPTVTVTWSEALDEASVPTGAGGFRVRIGNANGPAVSAVAVSGATTTLSLASAIADGTANVKLEYTPPRSGAKIRDAAGNDAAAIPRDDALAVTVTPDQRAPEVSGTPTVDGTTLTLTFDEALDTASIPAAPGGFTVTVTRVDDAVPGHTVSGIAVSGATVTLTLAKGVLRGDTVTLDYVPTSTRLQDRAATPNPVAGFSGLDMKMVDNASDALEVSLSTTEAVEGDDGTVTLTVKVTGGGTSGVARAIAIAPVASPTAAETEDWTLPAGQRSLTLGAGQRSVSAAISVVDDARLEDAETVSFAVTADGAAIGQVTLTIADDDKAVLAVRGPAQVTEGQPIELTLRLEPHPENVANVSAVPDDACILDFPVTATLTRAGDIAAALPSDPTLATDHSFAATSFDDCTREVTVSVPTRAPDAVWMADRALTFALAPKNSDARVEAGEAGEALSAAVRDDTPLPGPMVTGISISPGARTCDRPDPVNPSGYTKEEFLALPGCAVHGRGTTLTFTLTFDSAVTVTRNAQTRALPELVLDVFGRERRAQLSGNRTDTGTLTFTWTVAKGDNDPDGIGVARIDLKGASIRFAAGCMPGLPCDIDVPTFKSDHAQTYPKHRVRGGLHAMRLSVSGSAREGEPFTVTVRRDGGYKETAHAIVRMTDSGMESPAPGEASAENHGVRLMSFPFDADPEQGEDSRVSVQTVTPPGDGVADARTLTFKMFATDVGDSGVSYWYVTRDPVEATVTVTDTGLAGGTPDGPSLGVWDDWTREPTQEQWDRGRRFPLRFDVTVPWPNVLRPRGEAKVTVQYETRDGTATVADRDYVATRGTLTFEPGETRKTVVVQVRPDRHDEGEETMTLVLSSATGAAIARAEAVGTIRNNGPIPKAWIARFGRTVAEQVLEAVEGRMRAAPVPGAEVALAGERIGAQSPDRGPDRAEPGSDAEREARQEEEARRDTQRLAGWLKGETDPEEAQRLTSRAVTPRDLLTGSSFALTAETDGKDLVSLWGRAAVTRFDGREGDLMLDGEVVTGMLGADWTRGRWTAGLIVSHSTAEGGYSGAPDAGDAGSGGKVEATLTGLFPWARHALSERLEAWGAAGYGAGELTVTPKAPGTGGDGPAIHADLDLRMAAAGLRGTILDGGADGLTLIGKIDAMAVQTASGRGRGTDGGNLEPARATVTRLRLGVEASRPILFDGGFTLTPSLEIGVRHDGGDAETGFGLDLGGGLALSDPKRGLQAELRGRGLLTHESKGFRDLGFSGSLAWEGNPGSDRGAKLRLTQTVGGSSSGGADALLSRTTLEGLAANDDGAGGDDELKSRRLELKFGYGLSAFGDRFTWTPEVGVDLSDTGRDYSLGWRLVRGAGSGGDGGSLDLSFEARRRESANDDTPPVHEVGLRLTARF